MKKLISLLILPLQLIAGEYCFNHGKEAAKYDMRVILEQRIDEITSMLHSLEVHLDVRQKPYKQYHEYFSGKLSFYEEVQEMIQDDNPQSYYDEY